MITITSTKIVYVDIDNTLVIWEGENFYGHPEHIESIKKFYKRQHTLVAWSAGGADWARLAVMALNLEEYFTLAIGKPDWYLDDLPASKFMPEENRVFIERDVVDIRPLKKAIENMIFPEHKEETKDFKGDFIKDAAAQHLMLDKSPQG